jgi:hypothetical protein
MYRLFPNEPTCSSWIGPKEANSGGRRLLTAANARQTGVFVVVVVEQFVLLLLFRVFTLT